jgi:hypothetical protein
MNRTKSFGSYLNAINSQVSEVSARNENNGISAGSITGDSLSENITLFGSAIQSKDYISGSNGWKIDGTGVAEFSDVFVRGDINAQTGTIGYWNISSPGVTRTIGNRVLFGTFLESNDFGEKDDEVTSGVYVGLFKSYYESASPVTSRIRKSNLATVKILGNTYKSGDQVYVTVNEDSSFNNGGLPVTVVSSTNESITYYNVGSDFPTYNANGIPVTTVSTGEAYLYNPDVAGLYIQDYGKNSLDYGYFSNQGVAYTSASRVNLIHNPSFEMDYTASITSISTAGSITTYVGSNNFMVGQTVTVTDSDTAVYNVSNQYILTANSTQFTITAPAPSGATSTANAVSRAPSTTAWTVGNNISNSAISVFRYTNLSNQLLTTSTFAGYITWSITAPSASRYFRATLNYSKGVDYHVFDLDKVLYLKFDSHFSVSPYSATYSSISSTDANCTITTTTAHGFSVGDLVAIDFSLVDATDAEFVANNITPTPGSGKYPLQLSNTTTNIAVVTVIGRTNTTFTYANPTGQAQSGTPLATANSGRALKIYKVAYSAIDLSQILFEFSNGQTTPIANVINDMTTAAWVTNANKYLALDPLQFFLEYISPSSGIPPLQEISSVPLMVDSNKLRLEYSAKDATGYAAKNNITINLPIVVYSQGENAVTGTYTSSTIFQMSSNVAVTAISGNGTTVTYTASNNFAVGDRVNITGATTPAYNLSNVAVATLIGTAPNYTGFTVTNGATGATSTATAVAYKSSYRFIDAVSFSTEPVPFFGNTSSDYSWEDNTLNGTNQISLQDTKKWIDINLDDQTGYISNLDYLGFKQSRLNIPLLSQPNIKTTSDYTSDIGAYYAPFYDYENLKISGGVSSTLDLYGDYYYGYESKINLSSSRTKAVTQILASYDLNVDSTSDTNSTAEVTLSVETSGTSIFLDADKIVANTDTFTMSSKLAVNFVQSTFGAYPTSGFPITFNSRITAAAPATFSDTVSLNGTVTLGATMTSTGSAYDPAVAGSYINPLGYGAFIRDANNPLYVGRLTSGTGLVSFLFAGVAQGSITVSGTTVSYNSFLGSHYTETSNTDILVGTVMETLDELVESKYHSQERLPKAKISDTPGSKKVYGVYFCEDEEDDGPNTGHLIAAIGASKIRIAAGVTVSRGDLLESNGDGCARVQTDDVIRSSTIGKVTSNAVITTYDDGSYLVPCVLYCG